MPRLPVPFWQRIVPLLSHRVLSVDRGSTWLKVLVVDATFGFVRVVHRQTVDLRREQLATPGEVDERLRALVSDLNVEHVAFVLPQHRCISQVVEVPDEAGSAEARLVLEKEATRLSGLRPENLQYEFARLNPFARYENPYWLTLCKAEEVAAFLAPVMEDGAGDGPAHPHGLRLSDVASAAQAMVVAAGADGLPGNAILVDLGANSSTVVILSEGQRAFATSLARGSEQFVQARPVVRVVQGSAPEVRPAASGPPRRAEPEFPFGPGVERWYTELRKAVNEWLEDHPQLGLNLSSLPAYLCGGAAVRPGLAQHLNGLGSLKFRVWSVGSEPNEGATQYCTGYGAALQALGRAPQPVSLLPSAWRSAKKEERWWEQVQAGILACLFLVAALLAYGTWINSVHLVRKTELQRSTSEALRVAGEIHQAYDVVVEEYDRIQPLLERQRRTVQVLHALSAVRGTRVNNDYWYVLFADQESYETGSTVPVAITNQVRAAPPDGHGQEGAERTLILELCTPSKGEALRSIRNQVVAGLSGDAVFQRVDALPIASKREWVDPKVVITNQVFAFMMQLRPPVLLGGLALAGGRADAVARDPASGAAQVPPSARPRAGQE